MKHLFLFLCINLACSGYCKGQKWSPTITGSCQDGIRDSLIATYFHQLDSAGIEMSVCSETLWLSEAKYKMGRPRMSNLAYFCQDSIFYAAKCFVSSVFEVSFDGTTACTMVEQFQMEDAEQASYLITVLGGKYGWPLQYKTAPAWVWLRNGNKIIVIEFFDELDERGSILFRKMEQIMESIL